MMQRIRRDQIAYIAKCIHRGPKLIREPYR
jgi:hypothetical protein